MPRSIRARLLSWYALVLIVVMGVFSAVLYERIWAGTLERVDAVLRIEGSELREDLEDLAPWAVSPGGARSAWTPKHAHPGEDLAYAAAWNAQGKRVFFSSPLAPDDPPAGLQARTRGDVREVALEGAGGLILLVGRSLETEERQMGRLLRHLLAAGGLALLAAFAGGWLLVGQVIAPIARMTEAASGISEADLSRRIDVARTESELGQLAKTLNGAFDRLEAAVARQARFTADASHELRTPLSVLLARIELALKRDRPAAEYQETLATCLSAAQRMKAVVEGLLTLARADGGAARFEREPVDLAAVVAETVRMFAPVALERKVSLRQEGDPAAVLGDRNLLREMATNLVGNAIAYNKEGGSVEVRLREAGGEVVLEVRDTGIGIPASDTPHIFERFYRVDKARSRGMGGSGLGLSITKWIVEAHGGRIGFESREGEGTAFTVRLLRAP